MAWLRLPACLMNSHKAGRPQAIVSKSPFHALDIKDCLDPRSDEVHRDRGDNNGGDLGDEDRAVAADNPVNMVGKT